MPISTLPPAPQSTDTPANFNTKAFTWVNALATFTSEVNAVLPSIDAAASIGSFNDYRGAWSGATTYTLGQTVLYGGAYWRSNANGNLNNTPVEGAWWTGVSTNKVLSGTTLNDGYTEEVYAVTGTTPALSPTNGSIQTWTLSANSTPTAGTWADGQSLILGVTASSYSVTWFSATWSKVGGSGAAPTLTSTGVNWIIFWKVGGTIRASFLGTA